MDYIISRPFEDSELYHHGIRGMRWGKRNGPPYPLDAEDHSSSEKKAGWRKSLDKVSKEKHTKSEKSNNSDDHTEKNRGLTDKQKKAIKMGVAVAATALATYGTYRLVKSGKMKNAIDFGKNKVDEMLGRKKAGSADDKIVNLGKKKVDDLFDQTVKKTATEFVNGLKKLSKPETLEETLKNVNPNLGKEEYRNNCSACGIATFLRTLGYDVTAGSTGGNQQILGGVVEECFNGAKVIDGSAVKFGRSRQDAAEMLVKRFGDNASGVVSIQWKNKNAGGHVFNWTIKDGIVSFFDGQSGSNDSIVSRYWNGIDVNDALTIARLDNAEIDFDAIKKYIANR